MGANDDWEEDWEYILTGVRPADRPVPVPAGAEDAQSELPRPRSARVAAIRADEAWQAQALEAARARNPEPAAQPTPVPVQVKERPFREPRPTTGSLGVITAQPEKDQPIVICDDLHIEFKTLATGKRVAGNDLAGMLKRSGGRSMKTVHALKGISFVAHANESIGVIGSNGSGKSTLMRTLTGLIPPTRGAVYANSRPNLLGVGAALIRDLSGSQNVILGGLAMGMSREDIESKYDDIVKFAGLEKFIDLPMRTYSSGMTARLKFAIATARDYEILIVDEALSVGDKQFQQRSEKRIRDIRENAGTIFLVSHSMRSIRDTCNRTIWIEKGDLRADGPTADVVKEYEKHK